MFYLCSIMENSDPDPSKIYDCIVIGAGISGVSFAHYLSRNKSQKVLVLEKKEKPGGCIHTATSLPNNALWRELGAHTCYNSYTTLLDMAIESKAEIRPLAKFSYMMYTADGVKNISSQISKISLLLNGIKLLFSNKAGKTVKEYFSPIVGTSNYNRVFAKAFRAVISQDADEYPAEIFLKKRKEKNKEYPRRFTFQNGIGSLLDTLVQYNKMSLSVANEVIGVSSQEREKDTDIYKITTLEGNIYYSHNIAFATDPLTASQLLKDIEPAIATELYSIPIFHSESLNIIVADSKIDLPKVAGIIPTTDDFLSVVSKDVSGGDRLRSFTFHFEKGEKSKDEKMELICKVLSIRPNDILEITSTNHKLPSLRKEQLGLTDRIDAKRENDSAYILGNYFYGLSLEDCVSRAKNEAIRYEKNNQSAL